MEYHLHHPFFRVHPQSSIDDAWEVFCCELLNMECNTHNIRRREPPDLGADLIWEQEKTIYQCKYTEEKLNITKVKKSIQTALEYKDILGWERYVLCTNVYLTGNQEQELKEFLKDLEIKSAGYWIELCKKFPDNVIDRFYFPQPFNQSVKSNTSRKVIDIPNVQNPFFIGREQFILNIADLFQSNKWMSSVKIIAISGLGGIGKTQVATEYAYNYQENYQAIFWVQADSKEEIISGFVEIARSLNLPEKAEKDRNIIVAAAKSWLVEQDKWLLILDNADDISIVHEFIPFTSKGHILITTRSATSKGIAQRMEIETLSNDIGALLLLRRSGIIASEASLDDASDEEKDVAMYLAQEMEGLPLALDQAGAYIDEAQCGIKTYLQIYLDQRSELLALRGGLGTLHPEPVATTWSVSFQKVKQTSPAARDLLWLCAFLHSENIPEELFTSQSKELGSDLGSTALDPIKFNNMLSILLKYSLIHRYPLTKTLSVHRLVQAVIVDSMDEEERWEWETRAIMLIEDNFPDAKYNNWLLCERLLPHVIEVTLPKRRLTVYAVVKLLVKVARYFQWLALYLEAEEYYSQALILIEAQKDVDKSGKALVLNCLAEIYMRQGMYLKAEENFLQAIDLIEQALGPNNLNICTFLEDLAQLYRLQGKYVEAEQLYRKAFDIEEKSNESQMCKNALAGLSSIFAEQGKYEEAEQFLLQALAICKQLDSTNEIEIAYLLSNLANICSEQFKYAEAEPFYIEAIQIWERSILSEHPDAAFPLDGLAVIYASQKKYAEAQQLWEKSLYLRELSLGAHHPDLIYPLMGLANICTEQMRYEEAEDLYLRCLRIGENTLGLEHSQVALTLNNLADLYSNYQNKPEESEKLLKRSLTILKKTQGLEHRNTKVVLNNYLAILNKLGKVADFPENPSFFEQ